MNTELIEVGDLVSFETADGLDILVGEVFDIFPLTIIFLTADGDYHNVPRFLAEQSTELIRPYRETLINEILDMLGVA